MIFVSQTHEQLFLKIIVIDIELN